MLCTNHLAINFNQKKKKKKQLSYKSATTRNTSHKQRKTKMEDVKEGLPHVFCSFKKVLASTQQTRLEKLHGEKLGKKKNSFSKLIRGHKLQRASRRKNRKRSWKKACAFQFTEPIGLYIMELHKSSCSLALSLLFLKTELL